MKRCASVYKIKLDYVDEYIRYHAAVWPEVLDTIQACNIRNFSIYYKDGYMFSYYEYVGHDYQADMAKMEADPITQVWWAIMKSMVALNDTIEGDMEEVFHFD